MKRLVVVACLCALVTGCGSAAEHGGAGRSPVPSTGPARSSQPPTTEPAGPPTTGSPLSPTTSEASVPVELTPHGKAVLEQARKNGETSVALSLTTEAGAAERVASALRELGATVETSDASLGYVRVRVALDDVRRVTAVDGVRHVDVDEPLSNIDPTP